jgi:hypothetical protein
VLALMLLRPDHGSGNRPPKGFNTARLCCRRRLRSLRLCWSHGPERAGRQTLIAHLGWPPSSDTSPRPSSAPAQPMARPAPNTQRCDHRRNWGYFRAIPPEREASFPDPGPYRIDSRRFRHTSPTRGPCTGAPEAAGQPTRQEGRPWDIRETGRHGKRVGARLGSVTDKPRSAPNCRLTFTARYL